jgi:hypothetical protein
MPKSIVFPPVEPFWIFDRECLAFPAIVDGVTIRCLVNYEALMRNFGAKGPPSQSAAIEAFEKHREVIQRTARKLIEAGQINERKEVLLRSQTQLRSEGFLKLVIPDKITHDSRLGPAIDEAITILAETLDDRFWKRFSAAWDFSDETGLFQLTLKDDETEATARDWYTLNELKNVDLLRTSFDRLRVDLLRAATRKHLEKIEAGAEGP